MNQLQLYTKLGKQPVKNMKEQIYLIEYDEKTKSYNKIYLKLKFDKLIKPYFVRK